MLKRLFSYISTLLLAVALAACATPAGNTQTSEMEMRAGVIEQISLIQIQSNQHQGVGAVVGGLVGLGLGSLVGGGTGRDVAMVAGALGGAYVGNEMQKKNEQTVQGQQIIVRTSNGVLVSVTQPFNPALYSGQNVLIQGNGDNATVVPR